MADQHQLEEAILERPNDPAGYAVYGDWLQAQGDPRGELVSVQAALASTRDTKRFMELKQTESALLGKVTSQLDPTGKALKLAWRFGFVHRLELLDEKRSLSELLQHPAFRFVQGVRIATPPENHPAALADLVAARPALLNRLGLTAAAQDLAAVSKAFPKLEHFTIDGFSNNQLDASALLQWHELRSLELTDVLMSDALSAVLQVAPWKKLRRAVLLMAETAARYVLADDLTATLALPELKQLVLNADVEGVVAAVCKHTNLSALQELEIFSWCTDPTLAPLLERREAIRGLKLVVHDGELSEGLVKQLRKALKVCALDVEVYGEDEAGVVEMDEEEARSWRELEERREKQSDYNHDEWN